MQLSSPGLTGRFSIPEAPGIEPRGRGVLDAPVEPGHDRRVWGHNAGQLPGCHHAAVLPDGSNENFVYTEFWKHQWFPLHPTVHGVVFAFFVL